MMRDKKAVYGGEISAHHYFRDFAYCDSGMIPWLLLAQHISKSCQSLRDCVKDQFEAFPSSGEINFLVKDSRRAIKNVLSAFQSSAHFIDKTDGISVFFKNWRFNLRSSNTEPLVRLNIEVKGNLVKISDKIIIIEKLLGGIRN